MEAALAKDPLDTAAEDLPDTKEPEAVAVPGAEDQVQVRITKAGDGKVHTGEANATGPLFYKTGDIVGLVRSIGEALEERHYGEIQ